MIAIDLSLEVLKIVLFGEYIHVGVLVETFSGWNNSLTKGIRRE